MIALLQRAISHLRNRIKTGVNWRHNQKGIQMNSNSA